MKAIKVRLSDIQAAGVTMVGFGYDLEYFKRVDANPLIDINKEIKDEFLRSKIKQYVKSKEEEKTNDE